MLGEQPTRRLVALGHLTHGEGEGLHDRGATVLVGVCLTARKPSRELAGEERLIALQGRTRRREHHTTGSFEHRCEVATRARTDDEDHRLPCEAGDPGGILRGGRIGPRQIHARGRTFSAAVTDQHHHDQVSRPDASRECDEGSTHRRLARAPRDPPGILRWILGEPGETRVGDAPLRARHVVHLGALLHERVGVLGLAAESGHEQQVRPLRSERRGGEQETDRGDAQRGGECARPAEHDTSRGHASPRERRSAHSPPSNSASTTNTIGMSQRSSASRTVMPLSVNTTSSASCAACASG